MLTHMRAPRLTTGFSLLELSVVLVIVSIVVVMGLEGIGILMSRTAYQTTQERMQVIKKALADYRRVYGYLPCPGSYIDDTSSGAYGKEQRNGSGVCNPLINLSPVTTATLDSGATYYGTLPVRDLGLPPAYMKDAYGSKFRYVVTRALTVYSTFRTNQGAIEVRTGRLEQPCNTLCQVLSNKAAYAVISFGSDRRGSVVGGSISPYLCVASASSSYWDGMIDSANCRTGSEPLTAAIPTNAIYDSSYNSGGIEDRHFDDLVIWQTRGQL